MGARIRRAVMATVLAVGLLGGAAAVTATTNTSSPSVYTDLGPSIADEIGQGSVR